MIPNGTYSYTDLSLNSTWYPISNFFLPSSVNQKEKTMKNLIHTKSA